MLKHIRISGYRSFSAAAPVDLSFGRINLLLGANGSGKSNLVSLVGLLNAIMSRTLQQYVAYHGAASLLHGGPQQTSGIAMSLEFAQGALASRYGLRLNFGLPGRLFIADENVEWTPDAGAHVEKYAVYSDVNESGLPNNLVNDGARFAFDCMTHSFVYQFNNTALGSPIRGASGEYDCRALRYDGGNLSACLYQLKSKNAFRPYYERIVAIVRSIMPQFGDFTLNRTPDGGIWLTWRDTCHQGYDFGPHQFSDGTLRFIALAVALLSPPQLMPRVLVLDEPELGLHPHAIGKLAGMIKMASVNSQVVVATQSAKLLDAFDLADVRVVDWNRQLGCTSIKLLDPESLKVWTDSYNSISDLWERNLIGGQP